MSFGLLCPIKYNPYISFTFQDHLNYAAANGLCHRPSPCPQKRWYYPGIDYAANEGTLVHAAFKGFVSSRDEGNTGYGLRVSIDHGNGRMTIYGHLSAVLVENGTYVETGAVIGRLGNSGNSTGPHLHFELRINGIPSDPGPFLGQIDVETDLPVVGGGKKKKPSMKTMYKRCKYRK